MAIHQDASYKAKLDYEDSLISLDSAKKMNLIDLHWLGLNGNRPSAIISCPISLEAILSHATTKNKTKRTGKDKISRKRL